MSRVPIRLRLSAVFAAAVTGVLLAAGVFVYVRLGRSLTEQLNDRLESRVEAVVPIIRRGEATGELSRETVGAEEGFAQVIGPDGSVVAATQYVHGQPLLSTQDIERARADTILIELESVPGVDGGAARVRASPLRHEGQRLVILVGASLEDRRDALGGLLAQLLVAGPIALVVVSLAGYALAAAALRPVEAMRERATAISAENPGQRLPLAPARDELRRLGETLNAMLGRLETGLARERRFVADASHELRTPLALLRAELELALRQPRTAEEAEVALRSAAEEVDRLSGLAEDLLVLARADEGRLPVRTEEIGVRDLLESVGRRFETRAGSAGRTVVVDAPRDRVVHADRLRLEQALGNLLDNALRHGSGEIRLRGEVRDGLVTLTVADRGSGFEEDFLPHAFERFRRADAARSGGAAGLGLTIVEAIARAHGGRAIASNRPGGGAAVSISLPATASPVPSR